MNLFKLFRHDLRCGVLRWRYVAAAMLAVIPCLGFLYKAMIVEINASWLDYMLVTFKGAPPVNQDGIMDIRSLPYDWLVMVGACLFVNLDYMLLDLTSNGQQVIIRTGSRQRWFISKCMWNLAATALYFLLIGLVELLFVVATDGVISPENSEEAFTNIFGQVAFNPIQLSLHEGLVLGLLLPYLTMAALSVLEMTICLFVRPVVSFLVCMALLVLSVYIDSPFVLGNGAMTIRSGIVDAEGQEPLVAGFVAIGIIVVCMMTGMAVFKHSDILGSKE